MRSLLTWWNIAAAVIIYTLGLLLYRLTLHPLSRFPGPRWTAITRYYEGYYDVLRNGRYTLKIAELHKKYGPIVRISPYELHVSDPAFFDVLYRQDAPYDKYDFAVDAWANSGAAIFTVDHDLHKARRQPMNPYFSKARVTSQQDLIHRHLDKLCRRLIALADTGISFDLGVATAALARDVANDFILGKSYNSLDLEDFDAAMFDLTQGAGLVWRTSKFVRFIGPLMQGLPISWILKVAKGPVKAFFRNIQEGQDFTRHLMKEATPNSMNSKVPRTVVHEIMDSKLPPSEKVFQRVYQDTFTVTGAGFETLAGNLRLMLFHIFSNPSMLQRLRAELTAAGATQDHSLDCRTLEQLPYLTALLKESLRLSPANASRMARVSRKTDIFYNDWRIPAGTAVGMTTILMHLDENLYPQPKLFIPDRWLEDGALKKTKLGFAPFSKGTRNCLGRHLAWTEMYITVAKLVQCFDFQFESTTAEDFEFVSDQFGIGTKGSPHIKATVTRRQD